MPLPKSECIWFNGTFVPWDEARVHVTAHAMHYGSSVFEGIRAYLTPPGPAILGLDAHIRRLFDSCRLIRLDMPYTQQQVRQAIIDTVVRNGHRSCYIRPLAFRDADTFSLDARSCPTGLVIITFEWGHYLGEGSQEQGVDVMVSSWRRIAPNTSPILTKAGGNYINSQFVAMEAKDNGFVEGITLDIHGFISEGSGENIFVVYRGVIYTPPFSGSILMGVTREYAMTLLRDMDYEVREQMIPRDLLYVADEVFFTGTAAEIIAVRSVDRTPVGEGSRGPVTRRLQDEFFGIVEGRLLDRNGWLSHVME